MLGTKFLVIWGGEPLTHKDLGAILEAAHALGMHTYITTNGYLLNEKKRAELLRLGVNAISVSLDHTGAGHDELRGKPGARDRIVENMRAMVRESGGRFNIGINMLINRGNIDEIPRMVGLAKDIGLKWVKFNPAMPGYPFNDKDFDDPSMRFAPDDVATFRSAILAARKALLGQGLYTNSHLFLTGMARYFAGEDLSRGCRAGFLSCNIGSRGDVTACTRDGRLLGNVRATPFADVWNSARFKDARRHPDREACRHCWQSCYAESSYRLDLSYNLKNLGASLRELGFTKHKT